MEGTINRSFDLVVEQHARGMRALVRPVGEIDIGTGPVVEDLVGDMVADGLRALELDLSAVSFIDSAGLQMLLTLRGQLTAVDGQMSIVGASSSVARLLQISGMQAVLGGDVR